MAGKMRGWLLALTLFGALAPAEAWAIIWTQTTVTIPANTTTLLVAANARRHALRWMNVGLNPVTVRVGDTLAAVGVGMNYNAAPGAGLQGGSDSFGPNEGSAQAFSAISTLGTTIIIWEGQ